MNRQGSPATPPDYTLHSETLLAEVALQHVEAKKRTIHTVLSFRCFSVHCEYTNTNGQQCWTYEVFDILVSSVSIQKCKC